MVLVLGSKGLLPHYAATKNPPKVSGGFTNVCVNTVHDVDGVSEDRLKNDYLSLLMSSPKVISPQL